jgi:imidazolonepropionase-like amidohydrolase
MQILFANALIADATRADPVEGHVLVEDGIIRDLAARPVAAPDRLVLDLKGRTLIPGLIDCHVHVVASMMNLGANAQLPEATAVLRSLPIMKGMLDRGFTTVRDVGGAPPALADAVEAGLAVGPRLVVCGKALSKTGGHVDMRPRHDWHDPHRWARNFGALGRVADGVDEVRRAARQELREGGSSRSWPMAGWRARPTRSPGRAIPRMKWSRRCRRRATRRPMCPRTSTRPRRSRGQCGRGCTAWSIATASMRRRRGWRRPQAVSRCRRW